MKKLFALTLSVLMILGICCSCTPNNVNNNSSQISGDDTSNVSLNDEKVSWDFSKLAAPKAVDSFDVPVLANHPDPGTTLPYTLYYNGKSYESGRYYYQGTYNGRHYFLGYESQDDGQFYCSCDLEYKDFKWHKDFSDAIEGGALFYNGSFYQRDKVGIRAYSVETKEWTTLLDASVEGNNVGEITSISDGWIYGGVDEIYAYNIETGELIKRYPDKTSNGIFVDGKKYGYGFENDVYTGYTYEYDVLTDKLNQISPNGKLAETSVIVDNNGDVWIEDYDKVDGNFILTLVKVHEGKDKDSVHNFRDYLVDGWYYYRYTPENSNKTYIARLNLTTGEHEYCRDTDFTSLIIINPYYWGYTRPQK